MKQAKREEGLNEEGGCYEWLCKGGVQPLGGGRGTKSEPSKALVNYGRAPLSLETARIWPTSVFFSSHIAKRQVGRDHWHGLPGNADHQGQGNTYTHDAGFSVID